MSITLSLHEVPRIDRAGQFPLLNPVFEFTYRNPTHALHLYDYHARVRIGSRQIEVAPGDITVIQAGTVYSFQSEEPGKHWCIHFNDPSAKGAPQFTLPEHFSLGINSLFYLEQVRHIARLHYSLENLHTDDPVNAEASFRLKALLLALHNFSTGRQAGRKNRSNFSWDRLVAWIDENLHRPVSLSVLAEQANLAPATLSRKFKLQYKTSLSQYLLHRRIDKAKSLLATTTLTIFEVGSSVGIPDPQYFNKQFRKVTGMSPSRYRDENQEFLSNVPDEMAVQEGRWQK